MRYSVGPTDRRYVKFLTFAKNIGENISNKYSQKLFDSAKKSATDAIKTASKRAIQKTAEASAHLIGNRIADKKCIKSVSKKFKNYLQKSCTQWNCIQMKLIMKDIYLHKKDNKLLIN